MGGSARPGDLGRGMQRIRTGVFPVHPLAHQGLEGCADGLHWFFRYAGTDGLALCSAE